MARWGKLALALGLAAASPSALAARRVAVVVGISDIPSLPDGTELPEARLESQLLAEFLLKRGGYDSVQTLMDDQATREAVRSLLLDRLPRDLQPGDTLLFAFSGQGFGGDFGDPHLLLSDSRVDKSSSALNTTDLVADLARRLEGVNLIVLLDAAHGGAAGGVALLGPTAKSLSTVAGSIFALSATSPGETSSDGLFFKVVRDGLGGAADTNHDRLVSASELHRFVVNEVGAQSRYKTHPAEAGAYDPGLVVSEMAGKKPRAAGEGKKIKFGGPVSYSLIGAGVLVAGGVGLYGNLRGHALCEVADGEALCATDELSERYATLRTLTYGSYALGATLGAVGIGLGFVPLGEQAWVTVGGRF